MPDENGEGLHPIEFRPSAQAHVAPEGPRDVAVVFLGASLVAGVGDPKGQGWVTRVVGRTAHPDLELTAYNLGVRGNTSADVLRQWAEEVPARWVGRSERRVVISVGANDVIPKYIAAAGLVLMSVALFWNSALMHPDTPIWIFLLPSAVLGLANAGIWAPLSTTATRNLAPRQAGAGSGVYNTTRQIGAVLGSAAIAVLIQARLAAELPAAPGEAAGGGPMSFAGTLPEALQEGFSTAMGQSIMLPAAVILLGAAVTLFFAKPKPVDGWGAGEAPAAAVSESSTRPV